MKKKYPNISEFQWILQRSYVIQYYTQWSGYMQDILIQNLTDAMYHS